MSNGSNGNGFVVNAYRALLLLSISVVGYFLVGLHNDLNETGKRVRELEGRVIGIERDIDYLKEKVQDLKREHDRQTGDRPSGPR